MDKKIQAVLQILLVTVVVAAVFLLSDQIAILKEWGYLGAFVISFLGAATILIPTPAFAVVIALGRVLDPLWLGVVSGIGSGLGEITGYVFGNATKTLIDTNKNKLYMKIKKLVEKNSFLAVFLLSFIPNPAFDIVGLIAGALKVNWQTFVLGAIAGRTTRHIVLAYLGLWSLEYF